MEPLTILRADPLDLLFENRNKAYGAYQLRKYYEQRLLISLAIVLTVTAMISLLYLHFRDLVVIRKMPDLPDLVIGTVDPIQPAKAIAPPSKPAATKPPAALEWVTPLIVRDPVVVSAMASIEDLGTQVIGLETTAGEAGGNQLPGKGNGSDMTSKALDSTENSPEIFEHPERMPEFPGGQEALKRFLQKNLRMPENNLERGEQVKVVARFVVGSDGKVRDVEITQTAEEVFNKEVRRVILKMPDWKPGMQHNRNVAVYFSLPVNFVAEEDDR